MPFQRPTLQQIIDRITGDFISRLSLTGAVLRRSVLYVLARAQAGVAHMLYGYQAYLARQLFPETAEGDYLVAYGSRYQIFRKSATFSTGVVNVTGIDGTVIPSGTLLQRADELQYETVADATISGGTAALTVSSSLAGASANSDAGVSLSFVSPIANVSATGAVASGGLTGATDQESDDELRARIEERMGEPAMGGSSADYVRWAKEVSGVTRVWVYPLEGGPGTLTIRFVCDDDPVSIIPGSPKVAEVQAHIDDVRPVTAIATAAPPIASPLDFTIALSPATDPVKAAVTAELQDLLKREAQPNGTLLLSHIREAISIAAGETDNTLSVPSANVTTSGGHISTMGTITWV